MRMLAAVLDALPAPASVLHLGGGAMTLPRYVAAASPGAAQRVVERDALLADFVGRNLPLPRAADITVSIEDARVAVQACPHSTYDVVVADVYQAAQMPPAVASLQFAREIVRVLRTGGCYAANVVDLPPLTLCRIQAATLRAGFADVCLIAETGMLRGRRHGNVVLAASPNHAALPIGRIAQLIGRGKRVLHGAEFDAFVMGASPMLDALAESVDLRYLSSSHVQAPRGSHRREHAAIVRHEKQRAVVGRQRRLELFDRWQVQVVGWFVKYQKVDPTGLQQGQRGPGALPRRERRGGPAYVIRRAGRIWPAGCGRRPRPGQVAAN